MGVKILFFCTVINKLNDYFKELTGLGVVFQ